MEMSKELMAKLIAMAGSGNIEQALKEAFKEGHDEGTESSDQHYQPWVADLQRQIDRAG